MLPTERDLKELSELLHSELLLPAIDHVLDALDPSTSRDHPQETTFVLALDANVLLNLSKGQTGTEVIDYLSAIHEGPVILPFQALLEFWNNHVGGITGVAEKLRKEFNALDQHVRDLDPNYREFGEDARDLLDKFQNRYGHVLQERQSSDLLALLKALKDKAIVPQAPRNKLGAAAAARKASKMPPGFKDGTLLGDFYVWSELLLGVRWAAVDHAFDRVVLVTDDTKSDWSTRGTAHPFLCSEMSAWAGVTFETWPLKQLRDYVTTTISPAS
jgi:hypothetical protein